MQNGSDTILTFYAILRSGKVIPKHILGTIYIKQQENILTNENIILELDDILAPDGGQNEDGLIPRKDTDGNFYKCDIYHW